VSVGFPNTFIVGARWDMDAWSKSVAKDVLKLDFKVVKAGIEYTMNSAG